MFDIGQIVFSKCGRDKGKPFVVIAMDSEYLYLVDGDLRKLVKPKKKKSKHLQITNDFAVDIQKKIEENHCLLDADIRKALISYQNK